MKTKVKKVDSVGIANEQTMATCQLLQKKRKLFNNGKKDNEIITA